MCSLAFQPSESDFLIGMNRDESKRRKPSFPPNVYLRNEVQRIHPVDPLGGTWICINEFGIALALLNWYPKVTPIDKGQPISRGYIIQSTGSSDSMLEIRRSLNEIHLDRFQAFRLLAFDPNTRASTEFAWDQATLMESSFLWEPRFWASSGHEEPTAQAKRQRTYDKFVGERSHIDARALRTLFASHKPRRGPFSICMHRNDAETRSYTELECNAATVRLSHHEGALCKPKSWVARTLTRTPVVGTRTS